MVQNGIGKMQQMVSSTVYTYEMSNVGYVNKVAYVKKWLVIHVLHKDAVDDIEYSIYIYI